MSSNDSPLYRAFTNVDSMLYLTEKQLSVDGFTVFSKKCIPEFRMGRERELYQRQLERDEILFWVDDYFFNFHMHHIRSLYYF